MAIRLTGTSFAAGMVDYSRASSAPLARHNLEGLHCTVIGAGALGNAVLEQLGLLGVTVVSIVDPDSVEPANLNRSILFRIAAANGGPNPMNKAEAAAAAASNLFPDTAWRAFPVAIADLGFGSLADVDLIIGCTDNELARVETAYTATQLGIPVCDGGMTRAEDFRFRASWFPSRDTACHACLLTADRLAELLSGATASRSPCWTSGDSAAVSSTSTLAAAAGAYLVETGFRALIGGVGVATTAEWHLGPGALIHGTVARNLECPFHDLPAPRYRIPPGQPFRSSLGPGQTLVLDWPVCAAARCESCGRRWEPFRRVGWMRRHGTCPGCGSRAVRPSEVIRYMTRDSKYAEFSPLRAGQPADHSYMIRGGT